MKSAATPQPQRCHLQRHHMWLDSAGTVPCHSYLSLSVVVSLKLAQSADRTLYSQVSAASHSTTLAVYVTLCTAVGLEAQLDRIGVQHRRCTDAIVPDSPAVSSIRWFAACPLRVMSHRSYFMFQWQQQQQRWRDQAGFVRWTDVQGAERSRLQVTRRTALALFCLTHGVREAASGRIPISLGGDHSIAIGTLQGILRAHPTATIIWIDAHAGACYVYTYYTPKTCSISPRLLSTCSVLMSRIADINTPVTSPSGAALSPVASRHLFFFTSSSLVPHVSQATPTGCP